jgi:NADH-quinone oxidoreductase subunit J
MSGTLLFILCSIACLVGALGTVISKSPVRGAVGLLTTIVGIAGLFLNLSAQFLAAIQLIVYAGAVVVLFVFVLMLLGADAHAVREDRARAAKIVSATLLGLMAIGVMIALAPSSDTVTRFGPAAPDHGTVEGVGKLLFTTGIVPFELATALLIVAVVGAIAVARGRHAPGKHGVPIKDPRKLFIGPLLPRDDSGRPKEVTP